MACAGFQIARRVFRRDAAADLHPSGISRKRGKRLLPRSPVIRGLRRVEQDDVPALQPVSFVHLRIKTGVLQRREISLCVAVCIPQAPAHDLLHFSVMYIYTWPEPHFMYLSSIG